MYLFVDIMIPCYFNSFGIGYSIISVCQSETVNWKCNFFLFLSKIDFSLFVKIPMCINFMSMVHWSIPVGKTKHYMYIFLMLSI
jgi:hypothetical protein